MNRSTQIAVTLGDPAGIGPEIAIKALRHEPLFKGIRLTLVGNKSLLLKQSEQFGYGSHIANLLASNLFDVVDVAGPEEPVAFGKISKDCGKASYDYLQAAINLAKEGKIDAIVTAPVHKESWVAAGVPYIGHTEALADLFGTPAETLFVIGGLRIFFLTRHVSLREALELIKGERLLTLLRHARDTLGLFGIQEPKIAVAALNPHAGDGGLFGKEEIEILAPAIKIANEEGIKTFGPLPADSVFHQCDRGQFDAVVALYHDQGHLAAKMKSFFGTVSVTTGLPVIRTSVDHGTAFDIAGKNLADPMAMVSAIELAARLSSMHNHRQSM